MTDSKDVYETEDLPEAEQDYDEEIKDCVEKINVTAFSAYNRFKGKEIPKTDQIRTSKNLRYENPFERSRKILLELTNLSKDIETHYDSDTNNKNEPVSKEQLTMLVEGLSVQVKELDLNKYFGEESNYEVKDPKKIIYKRLIDNIDKLKNQSTDKSAVESSNNSYIITDHTEVNEHLNQMKIANLLKRLDVVEKVLGDDNVKLSNIVSECPNKGLIEAVERLTAKTGLLNNPQLNIIESRLGAVANKLQSLTTVASNASSLDQESQMKIAELYELVKKWDHVMDTVPNIVNQCISMQEFHAKSIKLGQCITHLDIKHHEMSFKQQTNQMALKNIQNTLPSNFETMEKNMKIIDEKLKSLT